MDQQKTNVDFDALKRLNEPSVDTGNATAGGAATLTDTAKEWEVNQWVGQVVEITEGTAKGEFRNIISNTATVLTVANMAMTPRTNRTKSAAPMIRSILFSSLKVPVASYGRFWVF